MTLIHTTSNLAARKRIFHSVYSGVHSGHSGRQRGFTLIETLLAVAILLLAVTAPLTLAERSLLSAEAAKQELTALYLGQEGMEFVRNARDVNFLRGRGGGSGWLDGLSECETSSGCGIDPTDPDGTAIRKCDLNNDDCLLWQHTGVSPEERLKGLFGYPKTRRGGNTTNWRETNFKRRICITQVAETALCADDKGNALGSAPEAKVNVILTWVAGTLGSRSTTFSTTIFNWYEAP